MSDEEQLQIDSQPTFQVLMNCYVNPLAFHDVDLPWASSDATPESEAILNYLCQPGIASDADAIANRYREISTETARVFVAPAEPNYLNRLVWPLRAAKGSYALGNYLATIALCGTVMEMIAILSCALFVVQGREHHWTEERQKRLFGRTFERMGQDERVRVLQGLDVITDEIAALFTFVREKRRLHLHLFNSPPNVAADARACYLKSVDAMVAILGPGVANGAAVFNHKLVEYLKAHGFVEGTPDTTT